MIFFMLKRLTYFFAFFCCFIISAQKSNIKFESLDLPEDVNSNGINCFIQSQDGFLWMGSRDGLIRYDGYNSKKIFADNDQMKNFSFGDVNSVIEVNPGELWVSTPRGVFIYKSITGQFERFTKLSLERRNYRVLYKLKSGKIAIGSNKGLFFYDPQTNQVETFKHRDGFVHSLSNNVIRCVYEDKEGVIWVGTYDELNRMDPKTRTFKKIRLKKTILLL